MSGELFWKFANAIKAVQEHETYLENAQEEYAAAAKALLESAEPGEYLCQFEPGPIVVKIGESIEVTKPTVVER